MRSPFIFDGIAHDAEQIVHERELDLEKAGLREADEDNPLQAATDQVRKQCVYVPGPLANCKAIDVHSLCKFELEMLQAAPLHLRGCCSVQWSEGVRGFEQHHYGLPTVTAGCRPQSAWRVMTTSHGFRLSLTSLHVS